VSYGPVAVHSLAVAVTVMVERALLIAQANMARHEKCNAPTPLMGVHDCICYKNTLELFIFIYTQVKKC